MKKARGLHCSSLAFFVVCFTFPLRSQAHSAFQGDGLTAHELEVRRSQLYAGTADFFLLY